MRIDEGLPGRSILSRLPANPRGLARQDRRRNLLEALAPHQFAEAGHYLLAGSLRGLGRHIAWRRPRAAGRQDEIATLVVDKPDYGVTHAFQTIRNKVRHGFPRRVEDFSEGRLDRRAALIGIDPGACPI
jgi:hypothetical protein